MPRSISRRKAIGLRWTSRTEPFLQLRCRAFLKDVQLMPVWLEWNAFFTRGGAHRPQSGNSCVGDLPA